MLDAYFTIVNRDTQSVRTLYFRTQQPFSFIPGQFIELYVNSKNKHYFTISSHPDQQSFSITTRYKHGKTSAFKQTLFRLKKGDGVQITEPQGDFVLPKDVTIPLVFVALGLGITPYLAMAEWLATKNEQRVITLIRQAKTEKELLGGHIFTAASIRVVDHIGKLTADAIQTVATISSRTLVYIAGPEVGVRALEHDLKEYGVKPYQIVTDAFLGYSD